MRKPVIAGNWKMYKLIADSVATVLALKPLVANANHCEVVVAPVFTAIKTVTDRLEGSNIHVAGQDCSTESKHGAHTGEVAAAMLRDATPEQAQEMHAFVRRVFAGRFSQEAASRLRVLYGGSVKPDNIAGLMKQADVDGALVGGASLDAETFARIVHYDR